MIHANLYNITKYDNLIQFSSKRSFSDEKLFDNCLIDNDLKTDKILSIFKKSELHENEENEDKNRIIKSNYNSLNDADKGISDNQTVLSSQINNISKDFSQTEIQSTLLGKKGNKKQLSLNKIKYNKKKELIFKISKETNNKELFTNVNQNIKIEILFVEGTKRFKNKRNRFKNSDNIRKKIITAFINNHTLGAVNKKLKAIDSQNYFEKFPLCVFNEKDKAKIMNMTLKQFILKKELYTKANELTNYFHNTNVINSLEKLDNLKLNRIFNTSLKELYEAYINSDEFKIVEINRLKKKNMNDWYINRYINLSKKFNQYLKY